MCGICGVIQTGGSPRPVVDPAVLDSMTDSMTHRGPNDRGTYLADGIALGVRRLSIVDVEGGHQPFDNEDGTVWAVQNGELYNHDDLRAELLNRGHRFRSRCDTEVLPHLYEQEETRFAERLRGKFGIAIWDERRRRGLIARDRLGIKPLYYAQVGDLLVFGSELKSVLASGLVPMDLDLEAIEAYLTLGFVPGPRTPLRAVAKLMPGHVLVVADGTVRTEAYWRFPVDLPERHSLSVDEHAELLLEELEESVRMRLMSDVPLGAMLSGGLDSSLVVALMARHSTKPVETFSVGFADAGDENELADARLVASTFGANHHELELSFSEQAVDLVDLVWHLDEPLADLSTIGFLALCELAAKDVTVALSGQGADELLGGYARHRNAAIAGRWARLPSALRRAGIGLARHRGGRLARAAETLAAGNAIDRQLRLRTPFVDDELRQRLAIGELSRRDGAAALRAVAAHADDLDGDALSASLYLDAQLGLVDEMLHYFDRTSMARSLEVRVPFLDHKVVEHCAAIPARLKVHGLTRKYLLKRAARGIVPDRIIDKRKIGFFSGVVGEWFRAQTDGVVADYLLASDARYRELLDPAGVAELVRSQRNGAHGTSGALLALLMLELWLSTYLPRAAASPAREPLRVPA